MTQEASRQLSNPVFGPNKLKLGVFFGNVGGGARPTTAENRLELNWGDVVSMAVLADSAGFEALVPLATWMGWGGPSKFGNSSYEPLAWAAGLAQATRSIAVFSTTQVSTYHPAMAAKLATTVDHISGGRFAMNIVTGRKAEDFALLGVPDRDHDAWYEYADEWLEIVKKLWSAQSHFQYTGKYFDLRDAFADPKPIQQPYPAIMNAGTSDIGRMWAAKHADMMFTGMPAGDIAGTKERVKHLRGLAEAVGNKVQVWACASVVVRSTQQEADDYVDYFSVEKGDLEAVALIRRDPDLPARIARLPAAARRLEMRQLVGSSFNHQPLFGTPQSIVEQLCAFSGAGIDGVLLTFVNYHDEMRRWIRDVMPLLEEAGLRQRFPSAP